MIGKISPLEIIEANIFFPNEGIFKPHPVLVVSTSELFEEEEIFYGGSNDNQEHFAKIYY